MPDSIDPDPPESTQPASPKKRGLFGFARKEDQQEAAIRDGADDTSPQAMRLRLAEFETLRVEDAMIPRAAIVAVEIETDLDDLLQLFAEATHSRLPVYRETLDNPVGFVHIKDLVAEMARNGSASSDPGKLPLERLRRHILYVPPSMRLSDLLVKMQSSRIHLALVVDEYGGTDGLISLEDLVEEIVGEIEDEHDEETPLFVRRSSHVWEADARADIEDFAEDTGLDLGLPEYEDEINTLGGVAFALAGKIPVRGEILQHPSGASIEIMEADGRRIRRMRIKTAKP